MPFAKVRFSQGQIWDTYLPWEFCVEAKSITLSDS